MGFFSKFFFTIFIFSISLSAQEVQKRKLSNPDKLTCRDFAEQEINNSPFKGAKIEWQFPQLDLKDKTTQIKTNQDNGIWSLTRSEDVTYVFSGDNLLHNSVVTYNFNILNGGCDLKNIRVASVDKGKNADSERVLNTTDCTKILREYDRIMSHLEELAAHKKYALQIETTEDVRHYGKFCANVRRYLSPTSSDQLSDQQDPRYYPNEAQP